jgi:hypothetical protein
MFRIENLEVRNSSLQNISMETELGFQTKSMVFPCCLVLAQEVEQSAHVPRGLLRLPACLVRAEASRSV